MYVSDSLTKNVLLHQTTKIVENAEENITIVNQLQNFKLFLCSHSIIDKIIPANMP